MVYRVVLTSNGKYRKTLHSCLTKETIFKNYHRLIDENKAVKFPKRFKNAFGIKPVKFKICVTKPTESNDTFRLIRDRLGRTHYEKPLGDWTILAAQDYEIEETFWIYGLNPRAVRPNINEIVKRLMVGAYRKKYTKQVLVVYNKLVIYSEDQFDMIICKCMEDAQRLHHTLAKIIKKQRIKSLLFMGTATTATATRMYEIIMEKTGWSKDKIRRKNTRP